MKHIVPIIGILVVIAYSNPPLRLKRIPFVDTLIDSIAYDGLPFITGSIIFRLHFLKAGFYLYNSVRLFIVVLLVV